LLNSKAEKDTRWHTRSREIPHDVRTAKAKFAPENRTTNGPVFDPWERFIVPDFPLHVLPPAIQRHVTSQSVLIGCDPSAFAMSALTAFSGALDHRFAVKMMRNGSWWERRVCGLS
jgi:hypothetical protein